MDGGRRESERAGLAAVAVLAIGTFATGTDAFIVAGVLPPLARSLDSSIAMAGQVVTIYALAYAVGSPLITTATANWPRRPLLIGSLLVFAFANVLSAISESIAVLATTRVVAALLAGLFVPTAAASASSLVAASMRGSGDNAASRWKERAWRWTESWERGRGRTSATRVRSRMRITCSPAGSRPRATCGWRATREAGV